MKMRAKNKSLILIKILIFISLSFNTYANEVGIKETCCIYYFEFDTDNFKDAIVTNQKPVVLSRGIHSNLLTWEDFAQDIARDPKNARDTWLIEMVGGPTIDEDCLPSGKYNCPNYTFSDLKTYYWPALIAGVEKYSGQNQIDYVGYSLGCSAALESLKLYGSSGKNNAGYYFDTSTGTYQLTDLASNPVDTFVAVACPGNFTRLSTFMRAFNVTWQKSNNSFNKDNKIHITGQDLNRKIFVYIPPEISNEISDTIQLLTLLGSNSRLSKQIYDEFFTWLNNINLPNLGTNVALNNFMIIQGDSNGIFNMTDNTDGIVPIEDEKQICKNINSTNKYYLNYEKSLHFGRLPFFQPSLADETRVKNAIKEFLTNKKILTNSLNQRYIVSNSISCDPG